MGQPSLFCCALVVLLVLVLLVLLPWLWLLVCGLLSSRSRLGP
jgi:hypothetical protein